EAHRNILAPAFRRATGATVTQSIILGTDQVARLQAAKGSRPPFDVAIFDSPQVLDAAREGLIVEYPVAKSPRYAELLPGFQGKRGAEDHHAGDRHRINPEEDRKPAEELGRTVGAQI